MQAGTAAGNKKQILVVEDEGLIADDLQRKLERLGYAVPAIANSGQQALQLASETEFDLVLMDIRLKGDMDGITTAQALRDEFQVPVVYVTANADPETVSRAKVTEPLGYVLKPVGTDNLRSTMEIAMYKYEMERRLRSSEAWLRITLRNVGEGVIATDPGGGIVFMNPVAEQLCGWPRAEAYGRPLRDVLGLCEENTECPAKNLIFDLYPEKYHTYSLISSKTGAPIPVEVACFENRTADDVFGEILILRDITGRRKLEARLTQAQRMEAIAAMAGGLAHDFNNLLMIIQGYAEELSTDLPPGNQEPVRQIQQAVSMAADLSRQLLMLSGRNDGHPEVVNLNEMVCEIQPLLSHSLGKTRPLATELGAMEGFVRADRNMLKQVFINLAQHAKYVMPQGGTLHIETDIMDIEPASAGARQYRPGRYVRLRVADSGPGMDKTALAHIFEPFFGKNRPGAGNGLGLSVAHGTIVQCGGYISADSRPGEGTTFEILLPCVGTFQAVSTLLERSKGNDPARTILLVEDEADIRRLMHGYLVEDGYQLLDARNAEEAEEVAKAYAGRIDVLVTDVVLPGMTGVQLAERLRPARPEMKALFVSGYSPEAVESCGLAKGRAEFLAKPFRAAELGRRIRALDRQEENVSSDV